MEPSLPAVASAVAAIFSAITAFVVMRIQHRNSLEAARPEIVLSDWKRVAVRKPGGSVHETISLSTIRNVGQGPALHSYLHAGDDVDGSPTYLMESYRLSILAPGESEKLDGEISVYWDNVPEMEDGAKYLFLDVVIYCWDRRERRHETRYKLMAKPPSEAGMTINLGPDTLAPGLVLTQRTTTSRPVWRLKLMKLPKRLLAKLRDLFGLSYWE